MATLASVSHHLSLSSVLLRGRGKTRQEADSVAIPKKGSRLISVDGTAYRWRIRHKPTYSQGNS